MERLGTMTESRLEKHAKHVAEVSYEAIIGAGTIYGIYQLWQMYWWKRYQKKHASTISFSDWKKLDE
jgi:hypothetical protein